MTLDLTSKEDLIQQISEARFGKGAEPISRATWWRWCGECKVSPTNTHYHPNETRALHRYAQQLATKDLNQE